MRHSFGKKDITLARNTGIIRNRKLYIKNSNNNNKYKPPFEQILLLQTNCKEL